MLLRLLCEIDIPFRRADVSLRVGALCMCNLGTGVLFLIEKWSY